MDCTRIPPPPAWTTPSLLFCPSHQDISLKLTEPYPASGPQSALKNKMPVYHSTGPCIVVFQSTTSCMDRECNFGWDFGILEHVL